MDLVNLTLINYKIVNSWFFKSSRWKADMLLYSLEQIVYSKFVLQFWFRGSNVWRFSKLIGLGNTASLEILTWVEHCIFAQMLECCKANWETYYCPGTSSVHRRVLSTGSEPQTDSKCFLWNRWLILCHAGPSVEHSHRTPGIAPTWPLFSIVCPPSPVWSRSIQAAGHCCINGRPHSAPRTLDCMTTANNSHIPAGVEVYPLTI